MELRNTNPSSVMLAELKDILLAGKNKRKKGTKGT
jgi:hypothetical protein